MTAPNGAGITIASTATAVPPFEITREEVKTYLRKVFSLESARLTAMMSRVHISTQANVRGRMRLATREQFQRSWLSGPLASSHGMPPSGTSVKSVILAALREVGREVLPPVRIPRPR